jgi:predicted TIM-barrel enzyme
MSLFARADVLARLNAQVQTKKPIVGGGAGTGISAKCAEAGGIDLLVIYNSGRFRMAGRGSLAGMMPYGDANQIVMDMAREVLPVVKKTPVLAGVCGTDPFRIMKFFLRDIITAGFSGVQKTPYAFNDDEARAMAQAGADILIPHMGLTTKGSIGAHTAMTLEEAAKRVQAMHDAAKKVNKDILVLCHGGPISEPEDAQYILDHTEGVVGFYGASSVERLPTEVAITNCVKKFKQLKF